MSQRLAALSALLLAPLSSQAADMPKEGTDTYTTFYSRTAASTMKVGDRTITTLDLSGINRNDNGGPMFHNMGVRCLGTREAVGAEVTTRGTCEEIDKDGHQIFTTYEAKGLKGTHQFVGATGKYTGISGTIEYTVQPIKGPDGTGLFAVTQKAVWKLP